MRVIPPFDSDLVIAAWKETEITGERRMRVTEPDQVEERPHCGTLDFRIDFVARVVVTIDVAPLLRPPKKFHVIGAGQQSDVVDLRDSRREELQRTGNPVFPVATAERVIESAIDLRYVQIVRRLAAGLAAFAIASLMNRLNKIEISSELSSPSASMTPIPSCVSSTVTALRGLIESQCFKAPAYACTARAEPAAEERSRKPNPLALQAGSGPRNGRAFPPVLPFRAPAPSP